jgi:hypothetical protein
MHGWERTGFIENPKHSTPAPLGPDFALPRTAVQTRPAKNPKHGFHPLPIGTAGKLRHDRHQRTPALRQLGALGQDEASICDFRFNRHVRHGGTMPLNEGGSSGLTMGSRSDLEGSTDRKANGGAWPMRQPRPSSTDPPGSRTNDRKVWCWTVRRGSENRKCAGADRTHFGHLAEPNGPERGQAESLNFGRRRWARSSFLAILSGIKVPSPAPTARSSERRSRSIPIIG